MDASMGQTLAPQVTWALTVEASKFFSQTTLKDNLLDSERPRFIMSFLKTHMAAFKSGISHEIAGIPAEWKPQLQLLPLPLGLPPQNDRDRHQHEDFQGGADQDCFNHQ
jgi:hypothetical protein